MYFLKGKEELIIVSKEKIKSLKKELKELESLKRSASLLLQITLEKDVVMKLTESIIDFNIEQKTREILFYEDLIEKLTKGGVESGNIN